MPLDVVTVVTSLAAPYPVRERLGVNARLVCCLIKKAVFRQGVEDKQHELRAKLWVDLAIPAGDFCFSALSFTVSLAMSTPAGGAVSEQRIGRGHVVFIIAVVSNLRR